MGRSLSEYTIDLRLSSLPFCTMSIALYLFILRLLLSRGIGPSSEQLLTSLLLLRYLLAQPVDLQPQNPHG